MLHERLELVDYLRMPVFGSPDKDGHGVDESAILEEWVEEECEVTETFEPES
jgi:hypothetical protein